MAMKTRIFSKGQLILPAKLRAQDRIKPGQQFEIERLSAGKYRLKTLTRPAKPGLLRWLLNCPERNWFKSIRSEPIDEL